MTLPLAILSQAALIRVDLYDPGLVTCNSGGSDAQPPLLSRTFDPKGRLTLTAPPGQYTVVLTAFADTQETMPLGSGCAMGTFRPGASVCLPLAVEATDLAGDIGDDLLPGPAPKIALVNHLAPGYVRAQRASASLSGSSGDLLVAAIYWTNSTATVSISDSLGNHWRSTPPQSVNSCASEVQIWYAEGIVGGSTTVTVTQSAGTNPLGFYLLEYSGIAHSGALESSTGRTAPAASNAMTAGMLATTAALNLLVAVFNDPMGNGQMTVGSSFVNEGSDVGFYTMVEDRPTGVPAGSYEPTANLPVDAAGVRSDACWAAAAAAFAAE